MNFKLTKKAQVAMEFMILVGFLLFVFSMFFVSINERMSDKAQERKDLIVKQIAVAVQDEINLASQSIDGYEREFKIPIDISGDNYTVGIVDDLVFVKTSDEKHAIALPVLNATGSIVKGINKIEKNNGVVSLND